MIKGFRGWQNYWKLVAAAGLILALVSLALMVAALSPAGEPLRMQATLAPTLFAPLQGGIP